ncbi:MAG: cytochrome b [Gammaproteobacteria bacterium]|nr:cytochrome b [Gammaproteobacteria bacterium]
MYNSKEHYGVVAIFLHWLMTIGILVMFCLGWYMIDLSYYDSLYKTLPFIHKSIGITLAAVFIFRFAWRLMNPVPEALPGVSSFQQAAASVVHRLFYIVIPLIMVSGYLISTADGSNISVFHIFEISATITSIPDQEDNAGLVHQYLGYGLVSLTVLHVAAALKHHFFNRDDTLRRMLGTGFANKQLTTGENK